MNYIFRIITLEFLVILSLSVYTNAQVKAPELIYPLNNSKYQRSKNVELKWNETSVTSTYRFEISTDSLLLEPYLILDVMGNEITVDLLEYNTTYYWRVRCIEDTFWSEKWSFTTTSMPFRPALYSPDANSRNQPNTISFSWDSYDANTGYILQLSFYPDFQTVHKNLYVSDTSFTITSLLFNHLYYWRVRAININNDESAWSEIRNFKTRLPEILSIDQDSIRNADTVCTLRCTKIDSASHYVFRFSDNPTIVASSNVIVSKSNELKIDSLEYKKWYYWQVLALSSSNDSSKWSQVYSFKTKLRNTILNSPYDASRNTDNKLTFSWDPVQFAEDYHFQLASDQNFNTVKCDTVLNATSINIDSLDYSKSYYWRINAYNEEGDSSKWSKTFKFRTRLELPRILLPINDSSDVAVNAELKWTLSTGATHYKIQVSNESLFDYPVLDTTISRISYRLSKLIPDTIYYWRVLAFNTAKDSSKWTLTQKFRTIPLITISANVSDVKNLSESPSDTLGFIELVNSGINIFEYESLYAEPDSLFQISTHTKVIAPGASVRYTVKINTAKIPAGITKMNVKFVRRNIENIPDTITFTYNTTIRKAQAYIPADTITFRNTSALDSSMYKLLISNVKSNIPLIFKKISIEGMDTLSFRIGNQLTSIPANDSLPLMIWFAPQKKNTNSVYLKLETNSFPIRNFTILLKGNGRGGELAAETYSSIKSFAVDSFETFTNNSRLIFFRNTGNDIVNLSLRFRRNYFKTLYDFQKDIQLKAGDTTSVRIKYTTPNFRKFNSDTLVITHRGFGKDTIFAVLKGTFDSSASSQKVVSQLLLNNHRFSNYSKYIEKNSQFFISHNPDLFTGMPNLNFRMKYYKGGDGSLYTQYKDNSNNYIIPGYDISEKGLLLWGELFIKNDQYKIIDSVIVLPPTDFQVIIRNYKTKPIPVPRSVPAEDKESAKTKWVMFGFPFAETVADSVFGYFGGVSNQKDGEWIIYQYDPRVESLFSGFNSYSFEPLKGYFFAQSLLDTFKITYKYLNNVATRKLTDTIINVPGENWKIISNPYLFDVEVDESIPIMKYDINYNSYRMVNYMKPGEAYFVEPSVNKVQIKTFGKYNPLLYPGVLVGYDWHLKITASGAGSTHEIYAAIERNRISKYSDLNEHLLPPALDNELEFFIRSSNNQKLQICTAQGKDGATWDLVIRSKYDQDVSLSSEIFGKFPENYKYKLYDLDNKRFIDMNSRLFLPKNSETVFKIIAGTEEFIREKVHSFNEVPDEYYLSQNYPNPFNSSTSIIYQIPSGNDLTKVELKLFDILGREVASLVDDYKSAGRYEVKIDVPLSTGIYIYKLTSGSFIQSRKMIMLK